MPKSVSHGSHNLYLSKDFEVKTEGSNYTDASGILKDGFSRLLYVVEAAHVINSDFSHFDPSNMLQGMNVVISSPSDEVFVFESCICFFITPKSGGDNVGD